VIRAVVFDIGETLVDESREYGTWADWLGIPRHTFSSVFGAVIASGRDYRETFQVFRPGFDLSSERHARAEVGQPETFGEADLYPDARPTLQALRGMGLRVGVAGNQTGEAGATLRSLNLPVDWIGTSDAWDVEKPHAAFFERIVAESRVNPAEVLHVGDRLDNDIRPAQAAGLQTALIRRGPWGQLLRDPEVEGRCTWVLGSLSELPDLIARHNRLAVPQAAR
jgi:HAD superfamily hydrolase (TIGR01549 family)